MNCPGCGNPVKKEAQFCPKCFARIDPPGLWQQFLGLLRGTTRSSRPLIKIKKTVTIKRLKQRKHWFFTVAISGLVPGLAQGVKSEPVARPEIIVLEPLEKDFFAKELFCQQIPIKEPAVVVDEALYAAYDRLSMILSNLPMVASNLVAAGVELHIIGRDQVTTDLPEWRHDKGKPIAEYNGLTRDQRTRGMGGRLTSCGEENLLKLQKDRYFGRDICLHEFSHSIRNYGIPAEVRERFSEQYRRSLDKGLWKGSYAGSNPDEFFAELTMWYFGTHGDLHMREPKPENGAEGLKKYDPEAFALFDEFYSGRIPIPRVEPRPRRRSQMHADE